MAKGWLVEADQSDGALLFKVKAENPDRAEEMVRTKLGAGRDVFISVIGVLTEDDIRSFGMKNIVGPF